MDKPRRRNVGVIQPIEPLRRCRERAVVRVDAGVAVHYREVEHRKILESLKAGDRKHRLE